MENEAITGAVQTPQKLTGSNIALASIPSPSIPANSPYTPTPWGKFDVMADGYPGGSHTCRLWVTAALLKGGHVPETCSRAEERLQLRGAGLYLLPVESTFRWPGHPPMGFHAERGIRVLLCPPINALRDRQPAVTPNTLGVTLLDVLVCGEIFL